MTKRLVLHPGLILKEDVLKSNKLTVASAAKLLGVPRIKLLHIVNEKTALTPDLAIRISKVFGGTAAIWLRMQMEYDLQVALANFEEEGVTLKEFEFS
ncbi:HigA family addiction module antitoxin [Sphingobacterium hungaricum]|uniref:Addiction module antidote protein, HigA family n=1 Tax=Sphingobacterium hungaricum TaxID=2082723 RepID=A0A928YQP0_9SPHI|nr:HigA family addiction module antitoxin [Sphingobacterium hungaricum]MBE8713250.1 addiction module antidote protein, HigA family [Sphingobacterium hungaricum]